MLLASENTFGVCLSRLHLAHSDLEVLFIPGNDSMHVMHVGELRAAMSLWKDCIFAWTPRCSSFGSFSSFNVLFCNLSCATDILVALSSGVSEAQTYTAVGMLSLRVFLMLCAVAASRTRAAVAMFSPPLSPCSILSLY